MEYCLIEAQFLKKYLFHILYVWYHIPTSSHTIFGALIQVPVPISHSFLLYHPYCLSPLSTHQSPPQCLSPFLIIHVMIIMPPQPLHAFLFPFPCFTAWYIKILYQEGTLFISCVLLVYEKKTLVIKKVLIIDGEHILFVHSMLSISNHVSINKYN